MPEVSMVTESKSDDSCLKECKKILIEAKISYEVTRILLHRDLEKTRDYAKRLKNRGVKLIIVICGCPCILPEVIASCTDLPVIGIPLPTSLLKGMDSLLSITHPPSGIPIATMGVGKSGAKNAALFACKLLKRKG